MRRALTYTTLLSIGLFAGCEHDVYVVEITPKGDSFERKLTCWHVGGPTTPEDQAEPTITPLSQDKLARLKQIYGDGRRSKDGKKRVFIKTFQAQTPDDVGGSGTCTRYTSPLGDTVVYSERFRGDDDLTAQLERRNAAADQLVDLLIGWSRSEIGNDPDFAKLHNLLDEHLRQDLKRMLFKDYVRTTDLYKKALEAWRADDSREPDAEPPEPLDVVGERFGQLFAFHLVASADKVQVSLACDMVPFETNGRWDYRTDGVTWEHVLDENRLLPAFSYAAWSQPNVELQKERFGRLILSHRELGEYVIWYQGLSPTEAAEWDAFLAKCKPDEKLGERIGAFRFADDPPLDPDKPDERPTSLADTARELILKGLNAHR